MMNEIEARSGAVVKQLEIIAGVTSRYDDVIGSETADIVRDCRVTSADKIREQFAALAGENRLLNIGIIGRVNAGKSSLLNSIFFNGDPVLPKAATPMTASLTVLNRGDSFSASVEYYSQKDADDIKRGHDEYKREWDSIYEAKKAEAEARAKKRGEPPDFERAKRQTDADMRENAHYAVYDQYERMQKSGGAAPAEASRSISAGSVNELFGKLGEYVGSGGRMMPWTKSVELKLPDFPENIRVVDTPGINDPVKSREARTEEYLKQCDVVFIISSAGQFVSSEDTALMDQLSVKEGVRELYFVASQVDNQLYGSPGENAKWNLNAAIENIRSDLTNQALSTLKDIKESSPEVAGQFDQLLQGGKDRVMVTSAMCHAMLQKFDRRGSWDADMNHVWDLLSEHYGDYFNGAGARASLEVLSGIKSVSEKIALVRRMKDEIIGRKQADYIAGQEKTAAEFAEKLVAAARAKIEIINSADIKSIQEQKRGIERLCSAASEAVDGTFEDCVDRLKAEIRETVSSKSRVLFDAAKITAERSVETVTKSERVVDGIGFVNWFTGGKYGNHIDTWAVTTIRAGAVKSALNNLVTDLEETLVSAAESAKTEWKSAVQQRVTNALMQAVGDMDMIDFAMLKTALRRMINNMELPELDLGSHTFSASGSGLLEGDEAETFIDEVYTYMSRLQGVFSNAVSGFIAGIDKSAKREKMSGMLFKDMRDRLDALEKEIGNKKLTLERLDKCLAELKEAV